jgi:hypothetical protein
MTAAEAREVRKREADRKWWHEVVLWLSWEIAFAAAIISALWLCGG